MEIAILPLTRNVSPVKPQFQKQGIKHKNTFFAQAVCRRATKEEIDAFKESVIMNV